MGISSLDGERITGAIHFSGSLMLDYLFRHLSTIFAFLAFSCGKPTALAGHLDRTPAFFLAVV
jgi:hypothetical protein